MRNACRSAFAAVALLLPLIPASAQSRHPNGLVEDSVDPYADARVIRSMRARMDSIHNTEHRPTVALVLSGGGAKGAAHAGVIRYLEELEIPVDMICGTSMGGLVGGIYSMGYDADFMDSLLRVQNWDVMLSDYINPSYYSYSRKKYRETYQISVPFHYTSKDFQRRIDEQRKYYDDGKDMTYGRNSFLSSLPAGYVNGFNVNNLLSSISVGYEDEMSFQDLPIPFFCVAADMVSLKAKNWTYGTLKEAMRSTMSIPGLFNPVRTEGMILVDGGVRNNYPVDLARAMGADIIIGVDLSNHDVSYSKVNNIVDIVMQFTTMLGLNSFTQNVTAADVHIKPELKGYNMMSFDPVAIDTLISRGYQAARANEDELRDIKKLVGDAAPHLQAPEAIDIGTHPVLIGSVEFEGLSDVESRILHRKINFKAGSKVDKEEMDRIMSIIQATECFSSVTYSIKGREEPYQLIINCVNGPNNQFGAALRFDTEEWASFRFNVGLNTRRLSGFKLDVDMEIGRNQMLEARGSLDLSWLPTINVDARIDHVSNYIYTNGNIASSYQDINWWGHRERLYFSNIRWTKFDFKVGAQYRYFMLNRNSNFGDWTTYNQSRGGYIGVFGDATLYTMDRSYYPSHGVKLDFGYSFDFFKQRFPTFNPIHTAYANFTGVIPFGHVFAVIPSVHARGVFGGTLDPFDPSFSYAHMNYIGGALPDRNIEGQLPFTGFGNVYQADRLLVSAELALRVRPLNNLYFTATGCAFKDENTFKEFFSQWALIPGAGLEAALVTPAGPLKLLGTWGRRTGSFSSDFGLYISFGLNF